VDASTQEIQQIKAPVLNEPVVEEEKKEEAQEPVVQEQV